MAYTCCLISGAMTKNPTKFHPDSKLIDRLGGPAAVAAKLGFDERGAVQRVQNWKYRGIPEVIRLRRTDVFGPAPAERAEAG